MVRKLCCEGFFFILILSNYYVELIWIFGCCFQMWWCYTFKILQKQIVHERSVKSFFIIINCFVDDVCESEIFYENDIYAFDSTIKKWCESYVVKYSWSINNSRVSVCDLIIFYFLIADFKFDEFVNFKVLNLFTKGRQNLVIV